MATGIPVAKIFIKYNCNSLEENGEEEKEPINIEITQQKTDSYNEKNIIDFRCSNIKEDKEDIALANFIESLQKQTDDEIFSKK